MAAGGDGAPAPLVVTLGLDDASQAALDALRRAHFPPDRQLVPAHVSLFHALPGEHVGAVLDDVRQVAAREPFQVRVEGVLRLGRGTAVRVHAPELVQVHGALRHGWEPWLTRQDAQPLRAHVTVQNKVAPEQARAVAEHLEATLSPWTAVAVGIDVWEYVGGPWRGVARVPFEPAGAG